jgi:hypothetical protein
VPRVEEDTRQMRLIDYNEYENEVQRIQREAARKAAHKHLPATSPPVISLTPAIVLPAPRRQEAPKIEQKSRADSDLATYYSRTTERRDHTSRSPAPRISPVPITTVGDVETDEKDRIKELAAESFKEKIEILKVF